MFWRKAEKDIMTPTKDRNVCQRETLQRYNKNSKTSVPAYVKMLHFNSIIHFFSKKLPVLITFCLKKIVLLPTVMKHFFLFHISHSTLLLVSLVICLTSLIPCQASPDAKTFTLVIDAGHGGKDAGAVGQLTKEKTINLNVALAFGRMVERNCPDVKVVYTRKTDVFVPLQERANIANKAKADLFISIHTNAVASGKNVVIGAETYTLGMHRAAENLEVAKRENSVISYESNYKTKYQGFDPNRTESYIIFELMQDRYLSESIKLAKAIQQQYSNAGRRNKGVHQAGFLVLRETSMPSVLTELGFISNANEEKFLHSQAGTDALAGCLFRGFQSYRKRPTADATEGNDEPANGTMLADNSKLPPIYVAPGEEPSIRPVPTTPYMALTNTPQEHRATATPADIATNDPATTAPQQAPEDKGNEKMPPLASTLNLPPEKETPPVTVQREQPTPEPEVKDAAPVNPTPDNKEQTEKEAPIPQAQPAKTATPEIDPRTGQKLPPLASTLNLPPEKGSPAAPHNSKPTKGDAQTENPPAAEQAPQPAIQDQKPQQETKAPQTQNKTESKAETKENTTRESEKNTDKKTDNHTVTEPADHRPVFKIQLLTSSKPLRDNDPRLKGLKADCYQENGIYKYTYGATNDYQEILRVKKEISDRFFGIFVVAFVEGKRTDLTQAIQASKKK